MKYGVSVIICCYNSVERIRMTLEYLANQENLYGGNYELIVVNNASTDDLEVVVPDIWSNLGSPYLLKIVSEETPGLCFARMRGVKEAQYCYSVFCDDDNWLSKDYLLRISKILDARQEIGIVGGSSIPALDSVAPPWFYTNCSDYAIGCQAPESGDITYRGFVWGAGMGVRTKPLQEIFKAKISPLVKDRTKNTLTSGNDGEISIWYLFLGYRLWFDQDLIFQHYIPEKRLDRTYYERLCLGFKESNYYITYQRYVIVKYGLFNDPRKKLFFGVIPFLSRFKSLIHLIVHPSEVKSIRHIEMSIKGIKGI